MMVNSLNISLKSKLPLIFIWGFVSGVALSSFAFIPPVVGIFIFSISLGILIFEKLWRGFILRESWVIALFILALSLGVLRFAVKEFHEMSPLLLEQVGQEVELEGLVLSEPESRENTTRFVLHSQGEKLLVSAGLYAEVAYGDTLKVRGKLTRPGVIESETGRNFNYAEYLSKDDIYFLLSFAETELLASGGGSFLKRNLFELKNVFVRQVREVFSEPEASLLSGLIVSGREVMPRSVLEEFRRAGIIHIVVLSGYNISIIADFIQKFFATVVWQTKLPQARSLATSASVLGIIFFVIMTGAEATVVRASIMVLVVILAKALGRESSAPRALLLAGFLMLVFNPKILVFDPSFQLSFLATLALIYLVPSFEKLFTFLPERGGLRAVVATTSATQLFVLPLLIYSMGDISLVSLPANILVLPVIPLVMLLGFVTVLGSFFWPLLFLPLAFFTEILLSFILLVSNLLSSFSLASIRVPEFHPAFLVLVYLTLALVIARLRNSLHKFSS